MKGLRIVASLLVALACAWILFSDNDLLDMPLPFDFPAGNIIAAAMMIALAAVAPMVAAPGSRLHRVGKGVLVAAIAWLPVSLALAGGIKLSYTGWTGWVWMAYTFALLLAIPATIAWAVWAWFAGRRVMAS